MIEKSISFGPDNGLIGTLCLPAVEPPPSRVGQVLFNAGVVHRVGPHRINVRLARKLASRGIASIRFDLAGLGDSARARSDLPFEGQAVADLRNAMNALSAASGATRFAIFGFCSGGCHGYEAAQADARIAGLVLYDTFVYRTLRSRLNRIVRPIRARGVLDVGLGWAGRQPAAWAARARAWMGGGGKSDRRGDAGYFPTPSRAEFARTIRMLHDRGTRVAVMHSGGFPSYNYAGQFHDAFRGTGIEKVVSYDYFPEMGHTATILARQELFVKRLEEFAVSLDPSHPSP